MRFSRLPARALAALSLARAALCCSFIVANFDVNGTHRPFGEALDAALWRSKLRGPDATSWILHQGWTIVHNLLSLTGNFTLQPFLSSDGTVVAVFNGEVYNHRELAAELTGDPEAFASDGLSLLPAYFRWGPSFVQHLDGEFAIVVIDLARQIVLLSTDAFSTKPLWYGNLAVGPASHRFVAASYESALAGLGIPDLHRHKAAANEALVVPFGAFSSSRPIVWRTRTNHFPIHTWDLEQHKTSTLDWERAFVSAVRKRTAFLRKRPFLGLSSGYDSGAIALSLKLLNQPHLAIGVRGTENADVMKQRALTHGQSFEMFDADTRTTIDQTFWLRQHVEAYHDVIYSPRGRRTASATIPDDRAAVGLSLIIARAHQRAAPVYLSGAGADEIISDYSLGPHRCTNHFVCDFDGDFPANLSDIYPSVWRNFYDHKQRAGLMRTELTAGAHGVEGRYPFLDPEVVQEFLSLSQALKNSEYKRPIADFLRRHRYPNLYLEKEGFKSAIPKIHSGCVSC